MEAGNFEEVSKAAGMRIKTKQTITEKWPNKLKKRAGQSGAQEEFLALTASSQGAHECYLEWARRNG